MTTLSKDNVVYITQICLNCNGRIQTVRAGGTLHVEETNVDNGRR